MTQLFDREAVVASLPKRAQKVYNKLREGRFYVAYTNRVPKVMTLLMEKGLVGIAGRSEVIKACYVPRGYVNRTEIFPHEPPKEAVKIGDYVTLLLLEGKWDDETRQGIVVAINSEANIYTCLGQLGVYEGYDPVIVTNPTAEIRRVSKVLLEYMGKIPSALKE